MQTAGSCSYFLQAKSFFDAVVLPNQQVKIETGSGGVGPIDLKFFYTPDEVYSMVKAYGEPGRANYRFFELTGDIFYPIVYSLFFSLAITWLFQRGFASKSKMQKFNIVPFGAWLFDLFENLSIVTMLSVYPSTPALLAWIATTFTMVKWMFLVPTVVLLLIGLITAIKNGFKKQT